MRIEFTIRTAAGDCDVVVDAPSVTPLRIVQQRLLELLDLAPGGQLTHQGRPFDLGAPLAAAELRTGALVTAGVTEPAPVGPAALALRVIAGPSAGTVVPLSRGRFTIGRDAGNDVVLADDRISRRHATLEVGAGGVTITDHDSTNGTAIHDMAIAGATGSRPPGTVRSDDVVRIGDSLLTVQRSTLAPAALTVGPGGLLVNRPPRRDTPTVVTREIELVSSPAAADRPRPVPWAAALIPAVAAAGLAWFTRSPIFLLFGLMSPLIMFSGAISERFHWRSARRRRAAAAQEHAANARTDQALLDETLARRTIAPDPATLLTVATTPTSRIWERRAHDPDLLTVRLGLADRPSALVLRNGSTRAQAGTLRDVPAVVDLRAGPLGVVGPPPVVASILRWLVGQLAVLHPPGVVDLALLLTPAVVAGWAWARWLPQLDGRVGVGAHEGRALVDELTRRAARRRRRDAVPATGPWTVVVVDGADRSSDDLGLEPLLADGAATGITAIWTAPHPAMLPRICVAVAHVDDTIGARLTLRSRGEQLGPVLIDACAPQWAEQVSRALAPLGDPTADTARTLPTTCSLSEVLGGEIDAAAVTRWWNASNGRPDTAIGVGPDGTVTVDLVRDGPHALIAGTTGAGKSQLLQSLVAGLAVRHPPDEITFLLIDYKGGAAFAECARLPHTAGIVTDLDPHLTRRALRALAAELARRERLFATVRAEDLEAYRAAGPDEPVARLVIVIDEFATLATDVPEFLHGVVAVARRGRSLGVHLVLATQRPGSAVTPEIRANTSLRVALRVTDGAESSDLIDAPVAAAIPRDRPGRAWLRCGDRLVAFQAARPVTRSASELVVARLDDWRRARVADDGENGLRHIVDAVSAAARSAGRPAASSPWCEPLPDTVTLARLSVGRPFDELALALVDRPDEQAQTTLTLDLARPGGVLVAGSPGSGRTTALITLALAGTAVRPPGALAIHVIDPAGRLRAAIDQLPHVGTVVGAGESSLAAVLLRRLAQRPAGATPAMLLIDGWDRLLAGCDDAETLHLGELLTALVRNARDADVTAVVTGDRSLLVPRVAGPFDVRLALRLADRADYGLIGLGPGQVPIRMPAGRGVRGGDGLEFQLAHAGDEPDREIRRIRARWAGAPPAPDVLRLRPLPHRITLAGLPRSADRLTLGLGGASAMPISLAPFSGARRWIIGGPPRSGKTTTLLTVLHEALRTGLAVIVAAPARSPLTAAATAAAVPGVTPDATLDRQLDGPTLLLVDDSEAFLETPVGDDLAAWVRSDPADLAVVLAGRCDDLVTTYRGVAAEVRRSRCGILLNPGPADGEILGLRLGRRRTTPEPPGRGVIAGDPAWAGDDGEPMTIQVAHP